MKKILTLAKKDFQTMLFSPLGAVLLSGFALLSAYFFLNYLANFNFSLQELTRGSFSGAETLNLNTWVVENYYLTLLIFSVVLVPLIALKAFSEEHRHKTLSLLFTYPLTNFEIIVGKFLGLVFFISILYGVALTLPLALIIWGDPEILPLLAGALTLLIAVISHLALIMLLLVLCDNPISAAFSAFLILAALYILPILSQSLSPDLASWINALSPLQQGRTMFKGILQLSSIAYFFSMIIFGLGAAVIMLNLKRD